MDISRSDSFMEKTVTKNSPQKSFLCFLHLIEEQQYTDESLCLSFFWNENKKNYYFLWALNKKKKVDMLQTRV